MTPLLLLLGCTNKAAPPADDDGGTDCTPLLTWRDGDGDGFGAGEAVASCTLPPGHAAQDGDCDDGDPSVHPGRTDDCDGRDQDCDGLADEDGAALTCYWDADQDGYGVDSARFSTRCACPEGYATVLGDCDDLDPEIHPGALEQWYDGVDQDCAGDDDFDADGDGWALDGGPADCDDTDPSVHPGATEICRNGIDDDCDGLPGRCETVGEVSRADATAILVGDDDATIYLPGTSIASPTEPGKRQVVLQQQVLDPDGPTSDEIGEAGYLVVDLQPGIFDATRLRTVARLHAPGRFEWGADFVAAGGQDLDGDGFDEFFVAWSDVPLGRVPEAGSTPGTIYMVSGPLSGDVELDEQPKVGISVVDGTYMEKAKLHLVDVGEDGSFTLALPLWAFRADTDLPLVRFLNEQDFRGERGVVDAPALWGAASEPMRSAGSDRTDVRDLDGDGFADLNWTANSVSDSSPYLVYGPLDRDLFADEADAVFPAEGRDVMYPLCIRPAAEEAGAVILSHLQWSTRTSSLLIFQGPVEGSLREEDATARIESVDSISLANSPYPCDSDLDGDGVLEMLIPWSPDDTYSTDWRREILVPIPTSGTWDMEDLIQVSYHRDPSRDYYSYRSLPPDFVLAATDLDGDGFHDLVVADRKYSDPSFYNTFAPELLFFPGGNGGL